LAACGSKVVPIPSSERVAAASAAARLARYTQRDVQLQLERRRAAAEGNTALVERIDAQIRGNNITFEGESGVAARSEVERQRLIALGRAHAGATQRAITKDPALAAQANSVSGALSGITGASPLTDADRAELERIGREAISGVQRHGTPTEHTVAATNDTANLLGVPTGGPTTTTSPTSTSPTAASPTTASPTTASPTTASPTTASPTTRGTDGPRSVATPTQTPTARPRGP